MVQRASEQFDRKLLDRKQLDRKQLDRKLLVVLIAGIAGVVAVALCHAATPADAPAQTYLSLAGGALALISIVAAIVLAIRDRPTKV